MVSTCIHAPVPPCAMHLMSEAIRAHQSSSGLIRAHQGSSEAIRGHQRPSEAIRGHQRPSEAIRFVALRHVQVECIVEPCVD